MDRERHTRSTTSNDKQSGGRATPRFCSIALVSYRRTYRHAFTLVGILPFLSAIPADASETIAYKYDALGRMVKVARAGTVNNNASECYNYDPADNRSNVTSSTSSDCYVPGAVSFSVLKNAPVVEGAPAVFTIKKSGIAAGSLTVNYATSDGTATAPADYAAASGTLTFAVGDTTKTITVSTIDDTLVEGAEIFNFTLSAPSGGATIASGTSIQTINDNDTCSGVSWQITNGAANEGQPLAFKLIKNGTTSSTCTVNYATANGTAVAGTDYTGTSGTSTFGPTDTSMLVNVPTSGAVNYAGYKTFTMSLSAPNGGATISVPTGTGTITDTAVSPPVANPDTAIVGPCGTITVNVTANDTDPGGYTPLSVTAINGATNGSASITSSSSITYTTTFGSSQQSGTGYVYYTVTDTHGASAQGTVTITIKKGLCTLLQAGAASASSATTAPPSSDTSDQTTPPAP